ncbi:hypothetical protein GGI42DRAFT_65011 [Trichoderma sp. SZMC 28013]
MSISWKNVLHQNQKSSGVGWTAWMSEMFWSTLIADEFNCEDVNLKFAMGCIEMCVANLHMKSVAIDVSGIIPSLVCCDPLFSVIPLPVLPLVILSYSTPMSSCQIKRDTTFLQIKSLEILLWHHHHEREIVGHGTGAGFASALDISSALGFLRARGTTRQRKMAEEMDDLHVATAQCMTCASLAGPGFAQAYIRLYMLHVVAAARLAQPVPLFAFLFSFCQ